MCFSAEVSFGVGAVLGTIGLVAIKKAKEPNQASFAAIPLLFSAQQFAEGFLWLGLTTSENSTLSQWSLLVYLVFSQVLWPVWIPFSIYLLEKKEHLKNVLAALTGVGLMVSCYFTYCLVVFGFSAKIQSGHIQYILDFPGELVWPSAILYFTPLVFSPFFSSWKGMNLLGLANLFSFMLTWFFYGEFLISVWCFFAALLSVMIVEIIAKNNRNRIFEKITQEIPETASQWKPTDL